GLNKDFYHQMVDSKNVEAYLSKQSGKNLSKIFDQYLRTTKIPQLEYKIQGDKLSYRWTNCIPGFDMPIRLEDNGDPIAIGWLHPTTEWKNTSITADMKSKGLLADKNFYITVKKVK
ncbi:MAG TPA: hypothetical protein VK483_11865, partial [Chitinophagaceae bacterium]|nr:hypothetical protein [Chitinophagaceae bacterium]